MLGAESSGTKLLTELLVKGGCHGSYEHFQEFDLWKFENAEKIVWRRSYPHGTDHHWPDLELDLLKPLHAHGYHSIEALVIMRDWYTVSKSQIYEQQHAPDLEHALENISYAYRRIFKQIHETEIPYLIVTYEALIHYGEKVARPLLKKLGLNHEAVLPTFDSNKDHKYFDQPVVAPARK